jgi:uncharacterized protein (DUF2252 family)
MARTRAADVPSVAFPIRFPAADLAAVRAAAAAMGVSPAVFIRAAAIRAAEVGGFAPEPSLEQRVEHLERVTGRHEAALAKLAKPAKTETE